MDANEFNSRQAGAERYRQYAVNGAANAEAWLRQSREHGTGTSPFVYDVSEAIYLLEKAARDARRALDLAVDQNSLDPRK